MAVIFSDNFTGTTIDTGKWTETDTYSRISQNNILTIVNDGANSFPDDFTKEFLISVSSKSSGVLVAQVNLTWTNDVTQMPQMALMLWKDVNNYAYITSRATTSTNYAAFVRDGGSTVYSLTDTGIAKGKDVKIVYDFSATTIKFYYWNGSAWTQMGTTQTFNIHDAGALYVKLASADHTAWNASDAQFDNFYMTDADYSTQYPSSTAIKTRNGLDYSLVKTVNGTAKATVKTINGLA